MTLPKFDDIKVWSPEIEKKITEEWRKFNKWKFNPKTKKKIYSIDTPPPYINAPIHMGHAVTYCFMDFFARYKRMKDFEVLFTLGLDRNGLPIETAAEKKFNISPFHMSREKFIEHCEKILEETSTESTDSFAKLGISFSSYKQGKEVGDIYLTDSPEYRARTQATFINLYKRGLIYEDTRINNWDPKLQTTVADSEVDYEEKQSMFNEIIFKVKETGEKIHIATTRPELLCTCAMVIFNPEDERYQKLEGKTAIVPIFGKEVPIQEHPYAKTDKGTGLVMMCSAGDVTDIQFFREMNLKPVIAINKDGKMNERAGILQGLKVKEAREKIIDELKKEKLLVKQTQIMHRTPISERSKTDLEFIEMPEFYLKQLEFRDKIIEISEKIKFYSPESKKILESWLDSLNIDWPISRRRFYATSIPLWHSEKDNLVAVPAPGKYYQPWKEEVPKDAEVFKNGEYTGKTVKDFPKNTWKGEERVLDTWFDSSISELAVLHYPKEKELFKKAFPVSLRPQGKEIVRTWLYYTILRSYLETGKAPFENVWINQHILDEKGRKMSKSLGNVINPQDIIKEFGSEALRLWAATEGDLTKQDFYFSKDKVKAELKTINKLLNVTKFVLQFKKPKKKPKLTKLDQLLIFQIDELAEYSKNRHESYDFNLSTVKLRDFLWETFASHYVELVKNRAYNEEKRFTEQESESAKYTLYYLIEKLIILLYPIIPQVTTIIGEKLQIDMNKLRFPEGRRGNEQLNLINQIREFNSEVWKAKKDKGISLREPIDKKIPANLKDFEKDLRAAHNLGNS